MRIYLAQINPTIGALKKNADKIISAIQDAKRNDAQLVLFPELSLCGYPPEDLLLLPNFIDEMMRQQERIVAETQGIVAVVGTVRLNPDKFEKPLFNSAAIIQDKCVIGFQDKMLLPAYDVFDECRYFEPGVLNPIWNLSGKRVGITICEDIWEHSDEISFTKYRKDPVLLLKEEQPDFVLNLSASPFSVSKFQGRLKTCAKAAETLACPLLYCNQVGANDSLIFDGFSLFYNAEGKLARIAKGFEEDALLIDLTKDYEECHFEYHPIEALYQALVLGVRDYFHKLGFKKSCFGLSGGIDSALVACIAAEALGKENILAVLMPSRYSSDHSISDSLKLTENLSIAYKIISIEEPFHSYLTLLEPHFVGKQPDLTEENLQARIRGMILMALSNKLGYVVLSTGNKSELAMGYATLYGDMCGGLSVISDVTKDQVYALASWINRHQEIIPHHIIEKAPSAELRPNQKDSDFLPDYEIIDNVLREYVEEHTPPEQIAAKFGYSLELVHELIKKIHLSEFKRQQSPPGLRVSQKSFTVGRRFPIVEAWTRP